ncbi:hypothetical protein LTR53_005280 [Teratosphaeriaceae sp. CCFEE 6253]|nr:hypothetical protein LTR53_005280 [Teratosphaeriaceae sp. CCFEE 6253]
MYDEPQFPFASLTHVAADVGLSDAIVSTGEQYITDNGIGGPFGHDVIQASTRVNYAQNLRYINGLLAMVCMATDGAESVADGNWQIFDHMLQSARANVRLNTEVSHVAKDHAGTYTLKHGASGNSLELAAANLASDESSTFDAVIIAAPYQYANLSLDGRVRHVPEEIAYVQLHVTLLTSPHLLSPTFFNMRGGKAAPKVVLTTLPSSEEPLGGVAGVGSPGFFSISLLSPTTNPKTGGREYLYKIFSPSPPNSTFLARLLGLKPSELDAEGESCEADISWIHRKVWNSYPYEIPRTTFEHITLDDGLYYTSAMDGFISTMETNALSGKNVARLLVDQWLARRLNGSVGAAATLLPTDDLI